MIVTRAPLAVREGLMCGRTKQIRDQNMALPFALVFPWQLHFNVGWNGSLCPNNNKNQGIRKGHVRKELNETTEGSYLISVYLWSPQLRILPNT